MYKNGYIYVILSNKDTQCHKFCRKYKVKKYHLEYPEIIKM